MSCHKKAKTYPEQLQILKDRGLIVADEPRALHCLEHHNYYRLSAYRYPLTVQGNPDQFLPGTTFDDLWNLYHFDRTLRQFVAEAVKRVEISVRARWAYVLAHIHGPQAYEHAPIFRNPLRHTESLAKLDDELARSREDFVSHYRTRYGMSRPPIWAASEVLSFGLLSRFYENLKRDSERKKNFHHLRIVPRHPGITSPALCLHPQPVRPSFPAVEPAFHHHAGVAAKFPGSGDSQFAPGARPAHLQHSRSFDPHDQCD